MEDTTNRAVESNADAKISLGGNIELSGFNVVDGAGMIVVKKIVGNYARRFSEITKQFELLSLTLKTVHEREKSEKYELHAKVMDTGKSYTAEVTDRNLFFAIDNVLKKVEQEISK